MSVQPTGPTLEYAGVRAFRLDEVFPEPTVPPKRYGNRGIPSVQCGCGRFAKLLRYEHGYNGSYTTETAHVRCTRCGTRSVRLV